MEDLVHPALSSSENNAILDANPPLPASRLVNNQCNETAWANRLFDLQFSKSPERVRIYWRSNVWACMEALSKSLKYQYPELVQRANTMEEKANFPNGQDFADNPTLRQLIAIFYWDYTQNWFKFYNINTSSQQFEQELAAVSLTAQVWCEGIDDKTWLTVGYRHEGIEPCITFDQAYVNGMMKKTR